jgi:hypothetical protein
MSRSHRKTPKFGFTSADSEKADKALAHRQERHAIKASLDSALSPDGAKIPHKRSGGWNFAKDGKGWVDKPGPDRMRK